MIRITITGASGFIGQHVLQHLPQDQFAIRTVDLRKGIADDIFSDTDVILHLAGKAHDVKNAADPQDYYKVNFELTKDLYDRFLTSNATKFIFISSTKAMADNPDTVLTEELVPDPKTHYGKSKLMAEEYIINHPYGGKIFYILRPCVVYGSGNKGNLALLFKFIKLGIPWPLGAFDNSRSFLSVENLCFVIREFAFRTDIAQGIYMIADSGVLSTNRLISIMAKESGRKAKIIRVQEKLIRRLAAIGDKFRLPFNNERLTKLTANFIVSNNKVVQAIGRPLPVDLESGIAQMIRSFTK